MLKRDIEQRDEKIVEFEGKMVEKAQVEEQLQEVKGMRSKLVVKIDEMKKMDKLKDKQVHVITGKLKQTVHEISKREVQTTELLEIQKELQAHLSQEKEK